MTSTSSGLTINTQSNSNYGHYDPGNCSAFYCSNGTCNDNDWVTENHSCGSSCPATHWQDCAQADPSECPTFSLMTSKTPSFPSSQSYPNVQITPPQVNCSYTYNTTDGLFLTAQDVNTWKQTFQTNPLSPNDPFYTQLMPIYCSIGNNIKTPECLSACNAPPGPLGSTKVKSAQPWCNALSSNYCANNPGDVNFCACLNSFVAQPTCFDANCTAKQNSVAYSTQDMDTVALNCSTRVNCTNQFNFINVNCPGSSGATYQACINILNNNFYQQCNANFGGPTSIPGQEPVVPPAPSPSPGPTSIARYSCKNSTCQLDPNGLYFDKGCGGACQPAPPPKTFKTWQIIAIIGGIVLFLLLIIGIIIAASRGKKSEYEHTFYGQS